MGCRSHWSRTLCTTRIQSSRASNLWKVSCSKCITDSNVKVTQTQAHSSQQKHTHASCYSLVHPNICRPVEAYWHSKTAKSQENHKGRQLAGRIYARLNSPLYRVLPSIFSCLGTALLPFFRFFVKGIGFISSASKAVYSSNCSVTVTFFLLMFPFLFSWLTSSSLSCCIYYVALNTLCSQWIGTLRGCSALYQCVFTDL